MLNLQARKILSAVTVQLRVGERKAQCALSALKIPLYPPLEKGERRYPLLSKKGGKALHTLFAKGEQGA